MSRKVYSTGGSDERWESVAPHLSLIREDAAQQVHALSNVFDATRWMVKARCPWRLLPVDFLVWWGVGHNGYKCEKAEKCTLAQIRWATFWPR